MYQVSNSVNFIRKSLESEEVLNQIVRAFGIITNRHPKGRPRKRECYTLKEIQCVFFN